jgi:hypothetical protein
MMFTSWIYLYDGTITIVSPSVKAQKKHLHHSIYLYVFSIRVILKELPFLIPAYSLSQISYLYEAMETIASQ